MVNLSKTAHNIQIELFAIQTAEVVKNMDLKMNIFGERLTFKKLAFSF